MTSPNSQPQETVIAGKYRLLELLGKGGMATVHHAVHVTTGEHLALKLMSVAAQDADAESRELVARFEREAQLASSVDTAHIVRVHDAGVDEAVRAPYIAMELLKGEDLNSLIRRVGPLRPDLALRITAQACVGLAKAHDAGVIHRDIKPSNLYLANDAADCVVVKLLDFGIAKAVGSELDAAESHTLTNTGTMLGSPHYMSMEQAMGAKTIDHRTDIWSLGIVLFKCLSGRTPYDDRDSVGQIIVSLASETPPSVQNYAPWVPPAVVAIVRRALARTPDERYPTANAMLDEIVRLLPDGLELRKELFTPLSDEERQAVTPRASSLPVSVEPRRSTPAPSAQGEATLLVTTNTNLALAHTYANLDDAGRATESLSQERALSHARRLAVGLGVFAVLAVAGWRGWRALSPSPLAAVATVTAVAPVLAESSSAAGALGAATAAPRARAVSLGVVPASAAVTVDGRKVEVDASGAITIDGELGSVHQVRLALGSRETTSEVVITEQGARPERVTLTASAAPTAPARSQKPVQPPPVASSVAKPAPTPAVISTTRPANKPEFDSKFE